MIMVSFLPSTQDGLSLNNPETERVDLDFWDLQRQPPQPHLSRVPEMG